MPEMLSSNIQAALTCPIGAQRPRSAQRKQLEPFSRWSAWTPKHTPPLLAFSLVLNPIRWRWIWGSTPGS